MLYRNYPRDFRYQMFTTRLPRGGNCFICNSRTSSTGLRGLPSGGHLVLAPYASGSRARRAAKATWARRSRTGSLDGEIGLDVKWSPTANAAVDATINPDFSQIESDVAQIGANERFALFFPEKRPFFLEGVELLRDAHPGRLHAHRSPRRAGACAAPARRAAGPTPPSSPTTAAAAA